MEIRKLLLVGLCLALPGAQRTSVTVLDYETPGSLPSVWMVNVPDDHASVRLTTDHPRDGKQCLKLHYRFLGEGQFQYLGVPHKVQILTPVHTLRYAIWGDNSKGSYGVQLTDAGGETHQYSRNTGQGGVLDFTGWRESTVDLDSGHETWGGDKNGKLDFPITGITLTVGQPTENGKPVAAEGDLFFDALQVESERSREETLGSRIAVTAPGYGASVTGKTRIAFSAPGFRSVVVRCWRQGKGFGEDTTIATVVPDAKGDGAFDFPADRYPHGPLTVRLQGTGGTLRDNCYLQLYNQGGVSWNEGLPRAAPPAATGMKLAFADDFDGPLSISSTDPKATYYDHKPPGGSQDFSVHPFTGRESPNNPFLQVGTYLRIRASDRAHSAGLISSLKNDGSGIKARLPCYFECRMLGPNAIGTWPAFWLMTDYLTDFKTGGDRAPVDELDIIEAYGGEGPKAPNAADTYMITPHSWNQGEAGKALESKAFADLKNPCKMGRFGIPSSWFETFHLYGCKVTATETIYYCDNIEVGRHATLAVCKEKPLFFMINLATGGGWPVDLSRYDGRADMYVDYIRVYKE